MPRRIPRPRTPTPRTSWTRRSPPGRSRRWRRRSPPPISWRPSKGPGPFTVFAPTDEAFAKLPAGTIETLLKPENKAKLRRILTYHVVTGKVMASDVVKMQSATAVSGDTLTIATRNGGVTVDRARVVKTDIAASNGVIHVIDAVILPVDK